MLNSSAMRLVVVPEIRISAAETDAMGTTTMRVMSVRREGRRRGGRAGEGVGSVAGRGARTGAFYGIILAGLSIRAKFEHKGTTAGSAIADGKVE